MPRIQRYLEAGAVFAYSLGDLADTRSRYAVTGAPTIVDSPYGGKAMHFDGANDYVTLGSSEEYNLRFDAGTQDFSVVVWVRRAAIDATHFIISKEDAASDGWVFYSTTAGEIRFFINAIRVTGSILVADTNWHCLIATIDRSGNGLVYVDGVPGVGTAIGGAVMATTINPVVGARAYNLSNKFNGDIDDIVVIPRILTPEECLGIATGRAF